MKRLKYSGPSRPGVDVIVDNRAVPVAHLEEIEVPGDVADNLLRQEPDSWTEIKRGKSDDDKKGA
jgi:hypothetical protein